MCCATDCSAEPFCNAAGTACVECGGDGDCNANQTCVNGSCRAGDGTACVNTSDCGAGSSCVTFYQDNDGDGFAAAGAQTASFCASAGLDIPNFTTRQPGAQNATDCCESDASTFPGSRPGPDGFGLTQRNACSEYDYNCDGVEASGDPAANRVANCAATPVASCEEDGNGYIAPVPGCGDPGDFTVCGAPLGVCAGFTGIGDLVRACL